MYIFVWLPPHSESVQGPLHRHKVHNLALSAPRISSSTMSALLPPPVACALIPMPTRLRYFIGPLHVPSTWGALLHPPAVSSLPSPSLLAPSCYMSTCFPVHCLSPHYYGSPMRPVGCFWLVPGCIPSVWNSARHIVDTCEYVRLTGVVTAPSPPFPHLPTRETAGGPAGHRRSDSEGLRTGRVQV